MTVLRLRYVQRYRDCRGRLRHYFRRKGQPVIPLPGQPGSTEFMAAYSTALAPCTASGSASRAARSVPGSVAAIVAAYLVSPDFTELATSSQRTYRQVLDPVLQRDGHRLARELKPDMAAKVIREIGATRPGMANLTKSVLRKILDTAEIAPNPFRDVRRYKLGTHATWTEDEIAAFEARWPLGTRERLAFAVLLYTGQRVGDAVTVSMADIRRGEITVRQEKTAVDSDDVQVIPVHPALKRAVEAVRVSGQWVLSDRNGDQLRKRTLSDTILRAAAQAGLPPHCVPHGLRKAACRRLAEAGCTPHQIQAISGHRSLSEVERYTKRASRAKLARAAFDKLGDVQP